MEEIDESSCSMSSPIVKVITIESGLNNKQSRFSILHRLSKCSNGTQIQQREIGECRICLQDSSSVPVIKPCQCTGTVEFVHEKCLRQWIKTKIQMGEIAIRCQMCQNLYNYEFSKAKKFACDQMKISWQHKKKEICFSLILYLVSIFFLIALITVISFVDSSDPELKSKIFPSQIVMLIYTIGIVLSFLVVILITIAFVNEYLTRKQISISVKGFIIPKKKAIRKQRNGIIEV